MPLSRCDRCKGIGVPADGVCCLCGHRRSEQAPDPPPQPETISGRLYSHCGCRKLTDRHGQSIDWYNWVFARLRELDGQQVRITISPIEGEAREGEDDKPDKQA